MSKPSLKVTADFTDQFNTIVKKFKKDQVLVGIPESDAGRKDEKGEAINNAALLAINNFGSTENHIPPRPVMAIGIAKAQEEIADQFGEAAKKALTDGSSAATTYYERAGIIASNSIKKVINSQEGIDKPSDATLRARRAVGFKGKKALIVTGQMRNAITYIVKGDE